MTAHLKWSLGGAGTVGLLAAVAFGGMLVLGIGDKEGLLGGMPMELLLFWIVLAILTTAVSAALLTVPTMVIRLAAALTAPARFRPLAELALAVPLGLAAAYLLARTYPDGARDSLDWYFLLLSIPGAVLIARALQWMDKDAECVS